MGLRHHAHGRTRDHRRHVDVADLVYRRQDLRSAVNDVLEDIEGIDSALATEPPSPPVDPDRKWYVIHTYSGYENKVKANLERRIKSMNMQDKIFRVLVPMEDEVEFKDGKRKITPKKVF